MVSGLLRTNMYSKLKQLEYDKIEEGTIKTCEKAKVAILSFQWVYFTRVQDEGYLLF